MLRSIVMRQRRAIITALAGIVLPLLACNAFTGIGDLRVDDSSV